MEIIQLSEELSEHELSRLNERLSAGEIRLDWGNVASGVRAETLIPLLQGLSLDEHSEFLGIDTVPESLVPIILDAFTLLPDLDGAEPAPTLTRQPALPAPEVWRPEQSESSEENTYEEEAPIRPVVQPDADSTVIIDKSVLSSALPTQYEVRDEMVDMVLRDLLGPAGGSEEEIKESRVRDRYLVGALAPDKLQTFPEELDELGGVEDPGEEGDEANEVIQAKSLLPSSIGMSFSVDLSARAILVTARWGQYMRGESALSQESEKPVWVWKRQPRGGDARLLPLRDGPIEAWRPDAEQDKVFVKGVMHRGSKNWTVTLFLINGQEEPTTRRDTAWIFQPELIVEAPEGRPIFQQRDTDHRYATEESEAMAMLYRHHVSFAVGHGVSVHAETLDGDPTCAIRLATTFIPSYDIPQTEPPSTNEIPTLSGLELDMFQLAETPLEELPQKLAPLVTAYAQWIDEQEQRITDPLQRLEGYEGPASKALNNCRQTLTRIQAGIDMIATRTDAAQAFSFMNRAMWLQRIRSIFSAVKRSSGNEKLTPNDFNAPQNRSWRVFQLAFILLNLPALTDLQHPDRSSEASAIADLLWFPTGGGKTEAYLGLTAYTLAIRRLQGTVEGHSGMDGIAVIMRYTLRLLTLQQFQRAAALICACETQRRINPEIWGTTPFRLGLWVGYNSTPNTTEQSAQACAEDRGQYNGAGGSGSPRQLTHCPWCGSPIEAGKNIFVEKYNEGRGRTLIYCGSAFGQCPFSYKQSPKEGLPVLVVDEEIYRLLPSLLIATVDKFAQLPWKGETQMLFGRVNKYCPRHGFRSPSLEDSDSHPKNTKKSLEAVRSIDHAPLRPPDLIIQDELHLISGPLGTLVGLYENAIDYLSTWEVDGKSVRPKVIAATATIRRASEQVRSLYMREVNIFPPQGLDIEDNFFSRQRQPSPEKPGRRYLGICANGRRIKAAHIRVYLALLSAAQTLFEKYGGLVDPWMTLVGYFNAIKDLGGMRRLVEDDITSLLRETEKRGLKRRKSPSVEELTSRKNSSEIPEVLNRLEKRFGSDGSGKPIDILLATNMISVGVDVSRLGLMAVSGQPKTTAEYIQATSRVGRNTPGLVCVVYYWNRPRDLSHYEQFEHYHATFYQQVEAISVTPFAPRALDRGLAALLTSLVRLQGPDFNANISAGKVEEQEEILNQAIDYIYSRAREISEDAEIVDHLLESLEKLKSYWIKRSQAPSLGYETERNGITQGLLKHPKRGYWEPFTCLNSLRDVEPTVNLVLDENSLGELLPATPQPEAAN
ncbi:helicase [Ktedonobacter sp. SOSP1-52]|uniref:DISARM system helicase DrmA n=1 Tax=Ktedonobacter sp. SOSP1-52 TaxID=2778366 RepID=UPI001916B32F|nr:DISARM system helicase DrmA [Ktedonobacter sp. SOSP1-52]GHO65079.1 helicase [Ktedonobacter sp. SOSP1-52]